MGLVVSMVMITIGAVMRFAITAEAEGFNVGTVGVILILVGLVGAVMSIVFWASWGGFGGLERRATVISTDPAATVQRTVLRETETM